MTPILIVPGRGNSEAEHWQSILESRLDNTFRVQQKNWNTPSLEDWSHAINRAVRTLDRPLLVAHSFGCLAAAYAQFALNTPVGATLFVAPADPERFGLPRRMFAETLEQAGLLIASSNDPWLSIDNAMALATDWGVDCLNIGTAGHINVASGHGDWPFGEAITESMQRKLDDSAHPQVICAQQPPSRPSRILM